MTITEYTVSERASILEAMRKINQNVGQIVFVQDETERVVGSLTDGDVRRCLLKGVKKESSVTEAVNRDFKRAASYSEAKTLLSQVAYVPILGSDGDLQNIVTKNGMICKKQFCLPVAIQAGGLGKRLYPYTKILPKPLIPVGEKPILELIIDKFAQMGCNEFYVIVNHKKNMIKAYFNETPHEYSLRFIDEDEPLGTGGGLSLLKGIVKGDFLFTNCDVLIDMDYGDLLDAHRNGKNAMTMVCARKEITVPYGIVDVDGVGKVSGMREKPCFRFLTNTGLYLVNEEVVERMEEKKNIGFPTIFEQYRENGRNVSVYGVEEAQWLDMGQLEELDRMREQLE